MGLSAGERLGPYEIVAALGAGGMGEVYRARDTRLERSVAIKILSSALTATAEAKARFEREAKVISQLQHPHICVLHDVGSHDGTDFLVMELLEGETLGERLKQGPMPLDSLLKTAVQIADGLDRAHRAGVVHRDLKPGNVMLTKSGAKLLDFGLAKPSGIAAAASSSSSQSVFSAALTMSSPASPLSTAGAIVGTVQYMSPEQIAGQEADARSDVFAYGLLLYEMATGKRAFEGKTQASIVGAILAVEPPSADLVQPGTPPALGRLIQSCLTKDPEERYQTIHDVKLRLLEIEEAPEAAASAASLATQVPAWKRVLPWAITAALLVVLGLALGRPWQRPEPKRLLRVQMGLGAPVSLGATPLGSLAVSRDGERLAFVAEDEGSTRKLYVRAMNQLTATPLAGTEGAIGPFFSPDGAWVAFFADNKLKKIPVQGGAWMTLADAPNPRGGAWGEDDMIIYAAGNRDVLVRVAGAGGKAEPLTKKDTGEVTHRWPQILPGGEAFLFTAHSAGADFDNANICVQRVGETAHNTVVRGGTFGRYIESGHIVYVHGASMFAVPFDIRKLEVTGQPVPVLEAVRETSGTGSATYAITDGGWLVYEEGGSDSDSWALQWLGADGKATPLRAASGIYLNPEFSPDGTRLAMDMSDAGKANDVYLYDWKRDTLSRLTFHDTYDGHPVWSPGGNWIGFSSARAGGPQNVYWTRSDGTGEPQRATESQDPQTITSWHPSGKFIAFSNFNGQGNWDVSVLPVEGDENAGWKAGKPSSFVNTTFNEYDGAFSPDGRWLAYASNESGRNEVYVRPFPGGNGKWQVSNSGGAWPTWSKNGRELYFRSVAGEKLMVAAYRAEKGTFIADRPQPWTEQGMFVAGRNNRNYALHPDGKRMAIIKSVETRKAERRDKVVLIQNFSEELKQVAAKR